MARTPLNTRDPFAGYGPTSIVLHWLTAIAVVVLFLTHEREWSAVHLGIGLCAAPVFLFRLYWRMKRGYPRISDQPAIVNLVARLVMLGFLACILTVTVTGLLIPPLEGKPLAFFDLVSLAVPLPENRAWAGMLEEVHDLAGHAFLPLAALHILGALAHHFIKKDAVLMRMLRPVRRGK
jgi:cytochrome b561